jgi:hypothetical protein
MGLSYSYEIITPLDATTRLVESLSAHLVPDDAGRLLSAVRASPERLLDVIKRESHESHELCLSFLFPTDEYIAAHGGIERLSDPASGRVAIGCVWSSLKCGNRFALFRGTAATSGMSRLFESSPSVRATFTRIGQVAGACLVLFDDEQLDLVGVWPRTGRMSSRAVDESGQDYAREVQVDQYCGDVLRAFGVGFDGESEGR